MLLIGFLYCTSWNFAIILIRRRSLDPGIMSSKFMNVMPEKQGWGFVIFRTDYSSDADWTNFMELYRECPQSVLSACGTQTATLISSYEQMWWMDDQAMYENASVNTLREHHRAWLAAMDTKIRRYNYPEYHMFLVVDAEVMERVRQTINAVYKDLPLEQHPFVKVFDAEAPSESVSDGYPGWMKMRLGGIYYLYEKALESWGMRELCAKHTVWFERDAHSDQTYYVDPDESESSSSDDNDDQAGF